MNALQKVLTFLFPIRNDDWARVLPLFAINFFLSFSYYILKGSGHFIIDDKKETCEPGDLVIIPAGSKFTYKGSLRMLLNVTPIFHTRCGDTLTHRDTS